MADSTTDGRTRVYVVPTVANLAAPTVAELNAGTDISALLTPDGLVGFEPDTGDVDNSKLNSTYSTMLAGRISLSGTLLRLIKQTGTDTVYNTLVYGYNMNVVIRRDLASATAWATSQAVEVFPGQCGEVRNIAPEANSVHKYEVPLKVTTQPNLRAVTA